MKDILITGGTGMLGTRLTEILQERGYSVKYLSRNPEKSDSVPAYHWDIDSQEADADALKNTSAIIHLAGAGVAEKRWSAARKEVIIQSRTKSAALLLKMLRENDHEVETFISASGISYYGNHNGELKTEESAAGDDFLADVTKAWEDAADRMAEVVPRVVKLRIGVVLSNRGGALPELARPVRYWVGAPLGSGKQPMSWIHIDDLIGIFIHALENEVVKGVYNAVSPNPVTNKEMTHAISNVLQKPMFLPKVPGFVLTLIVGEMAEILLGGTRISPEKIQQTGFEFTYPKLIPALNDLLT
jgi:uncharacterized protein